MIQDLLGRKRGIENLPAPFTGHNAVVLRLSIPTAGMRWRSRWRMDPVLVTEHAVKDKIRIVWVRW